MILPVYQKNTWSGFMTGQNQDIRANGGCFEFIHFFPFVVSLSNHIYAFCKYLQGLKRLCFMNRSIITHEVNTVISSSLS